MNYNDAVSFITAKSKFGSKFGLDTIKRLLSEIGNPEDKLKFVHIAGTNGKGSTLCYLSSILICAGYKVGSYSSPSVFSYNERFMIGMNPIGDDEVARILTAVIEAADRIKKEGYDATAFEIETAAAFLCFLENGCDICVIETGLGGRLDATNAVKNKLLAVITEIGLDHCQILGNDLASIAKEKLAIADGVPLCTVMQKKEIMPLFLNHLMTYFAMDYEPLESSLDGQVFTFEGEDYFIRLLGDHQIQNASLAVLAAKVLNDTGVFISMDARHLGLIEAVWHGRFEIIRKKDNVFVLDGAHNKDGAEALAKTVKKYFAGEKVGGVVATFADKDYHATLKEFASCFDEIKAVDAVGDRSLDKNTLYKEASRLVKASVGKNLLDGISDMAKRYKTVVICGTLSVLKDARSIIDGYDK